MQYLLTEEEFLKSIPASILEPFTKALQSYYKRKDEHLIKCCMEIGSSNMGMRFDENPLRTAIDRHRREFTEKPPTPADFSKGISA